MKNVKKIITSMTCSLVLALSGFSSLANSKNQIKASAESGNIEQFLDGFIIGSWVSLYDFKYDSLETQVKNMAEAGINLIILPSRTVENTASENYDTSYEKDVQYWLDLDKICQKYGMYYTIYSSIKDVKTKDDWNNLLAQLKNCAFIQVQDEFSIGMTKDVANRYMNAASYTTPAVPYVNLFPSYAGSGALGGSYYNYVDNWVKTVGAENLSYLSHDHYPLLTSGAYRETYYSDMEAIRDVAYQNGKIKTAGFSQSGYWGSIVRMPDEGDLRWNFYSMMAYGFKAIMHFNWVTPASEYAYFNGGGEGFKDFPVLYNGEHTEIFDFAVSLNKETAAMGTVLSKLDTKHAYHTQNLEGVEILPKNYFVKPIDNKSDFVISYMESKDESTSDHIMLFNNSFDKGVTTSFAFDSRSGLDSIEYFNPNTKQYEPVELESGILTTSFVEGEGKLYKLNGNLAIESNVQKPVASLANGSYVSTQQLELTADPKAKIYYTTDGSYPDDKSTLYTAPISIGERNSYSNVVIRAVSYVGANPSDVLDLNYIITDGVYNVAKNKKVYLTTEGEPYGSYEQIDNVNVIIDGDKNIKHSYATKEDSFGFAIIDLEDEYNIDKIVLNLYDNNYVEDVVVQISTDASFLQNVKTIFNSDTDNSSGFKTGTDTYVPLNECVINFEPTNARYVRVYNKIGMRSIFTEIEVYNTAKLKAAITGNWTATSGQWDVTADGTISRTGVYDTFGDDWDGSYIHESKNNEAYVLSGKFKFNQTNITYGYAGFVIGKTDTDNGIIAGVRSDGSAVIFDNYHEFVSAENLKATDFNPYDWFDLTVIAIGNAISIRVNEQEILYCGNELITVEKGQYGIHAGIIPLSVKNLTAVNNVRAIPADFEMRLINLDTIDNLVVSKYTKKDELLSQLPKTINVTDQKNNSYVAQIEWDLSKYVKSQEGYQLIEGTLFGYPENVQNNDNIKPVVRIFIPYTVDKIELIDKCDLYEEIYNQYKGTDSFTTSSWNVFESKLLTAKAMIKDIYLRQGDITVGILQLESSFNNLQKNKFNSSKFDKLSKTYSQLDQTKYTTQSMQLATNIHNYLTSLIEKNVVDSTLYNQACNDLEMALNNLVLLGNHDKLQEVITAAEAIKESDCSKDYYLELSKMLKVVKEAYNSKNCSQELIDMLYNNLKNKVDCKR